MDSEQKKLYDFIMERTQEGKKEQMEAVLQDFFSPPQEKPSPETFQKRMEAVTSLLKPEAVREFLVRMSPFSDLGDEPIEIKNPLAQPNREKWRDHFKDVPKEKLREAFECAKRAHEMQCDCWNTHCIMFGDCKKCIVFHLSLKQFPTCQRSLLGDLVEHYIVFSRDTNK